MAHFKTGGGLGSNQYSLRGIPKIYMSGNIPPLKTDVAWAWRQDCPPAKLAQLARHDSPQVRWTVARNLSCPINLLVLLATDKHQDVRLAVVNNWMCPPEIRLALVQDPDRHIRFLARHHIMQWPGVPEHIKVAAALIVD